MNELIDDKNITLYNELKEIFNITFEISQNDWASSFSQNKNLIIYYNPEKVTSADITHELLHCWIRKFETFFGSHLSLLFSSSENYKIKKIFSYKLVEHIGNCCDHIKMLPKFLELGYKPEQFLYDSNVNKCSIEEINILKKQFKKIFDYNSQAIDFYIGKFFAFQADHINFNYDICKQEFFKLDKELYTILENFWIKWTAYDITKYDIFENNYHDIASTFYDDMINWCSNKKIK